MMESCSKGKCRTCMNTITAFDTSITSAQTQLIRNQFPDMVVDFDQNSIICANCDRCLTDFLELVEKLPRIEEQLKLEQSIKVHKDERPPEDLREYLEQFEDNSDSFTSLEQHHHHLLQSESKSEKRIQRFKQQIKVEKLESVQESEHDYHKKSNYDIVTSRSFSAPSHASHLLSMILDSNDKHYQELLLEFKNEGVSINDCSEKNRSGKKRIILIGSNKRVNCIKCDKCGKMLANQTRMMKKHKLTCKGISTTVCEYCSEQFEKPYELIDHLTTAHFQCVRCKITFEDGNGLRKHKKTGCKKPSCKECKIRFNNHSQLRQHKIQMHGFVPQKKLSQTNPEKRVVCTICGKDFKNSSVLCFHKKVHTDPVVCSICGIVSANQLAHRNHNNRHHKDIKYQCDLCGKVFRYNVLLRRHRERRHENKERPVPCEMCHKRFYTSRDLDTHLKVHHFKVAVCSCEMCGKQFARQDYLRNHMKTHHESESGKSVRTGETGERKPKRIRNESKSCEVCHKEFTTVQACNIHMWHHNKVQTKPRRFQCSFCSLVFHSKVGMQRHEKFHSGDLKYRCDVCYAKFSTEIEMKIHESQRHEGERNKYECDLCGRRFARRFILGNHMLSCHGIDAGEFRQGNVVDAADETAATAAMVVVEAEEGVEYIDETTVHSYVYDSQDGFLKIEER